MKKEFVPLKYEARNTIDYYYCRSLTAIEEYNEDAKIVYDFLNAMDAPNRVWDAFEAHYNFHLMMM